MLYIMGADLLIPVNRNATDLLQRGSVVSSGHKTGDFQTYSEHVADENRNTYRSALVNSAQRALAVHPKARLIRSVV